MSLKKISFFLNGEAKDVYANPGDMLVDVIRDKLGLLGTKVGCKTGGCGACTVMLDGLAVNSCMIPVGKVAGKSVVTIEGVAENNELHPIQEAMMEDGAVQCGYCTPGIIVSAKALFDENPNPDSEDIHRALEGNICRCTGYIKVEEAIVKAASNIRKEG
ncbi:MAG: (2Fe-2S)-binding protein [Tissierellaceae bacterium]|nr:(2Fe-2S)-binding protein [Tissierellaceae bacterium]